MRIFSEGFEMGDTGFFDTTSYMGVVRTGYSATGDWSAYISPDRHYLRKSFSPGLAELYFRQHILIDHDFGWDYGGEPSIPLFTSTADTYSLHPMINFYTDTKFYGGKIRLDVNKVYVAESNFAFSQDTYALFEVYILVGTVGRVILKINNKVEIDYTGQNNQYYSTIDYIRWDNPPACYRSFDFDDVALNSTVDTDGKGDISWIGQGGYYRLTPSGSGTVNNWSNNDGVSASANYLYVDEYPNDGDTTYVYSSASAISSIDQYAMSDSPLGTNQTVSRIWTEARARKDGTDSMNIQLGFMPSGYSACMTDPEALSDSYGRILGDEVLINPGTSASWTNSDIDSIEAVIQTG